MRCYVDMLLNTSTANIKSWERDNGLYGGLSPLARGTPPVCQLLLFPIRFIPADAGNSSVISSIAELNAVYPRWRGELFPGLIIWDSNAGLSPLARGTQPQNGVFSPPARFIPAGAGNSRGSRSRCMLITVYPRWRGELTKHNLLLIIDFLSQSQSTNLTETHKQHIHYVKEHLIHWLKSQIFKVILYRLKSTKLRRNNFHSNEKLTPQNL